MAVPGGEYVGEMGPIIVVSSGQLPSTLGELVYTAGTFRKRGSFRASQLAANVSKACLSARGSVASC